MIKTFKQQLQTLGVEINQHRILVAISGGADSVVLAWLLHSLGAKMGLAHCNYHLREEDSEEDERFVRELAKKWNCPIWVNSVEMKNGAYESGLQAEARKIRYAFFEEVMNQHQFDFCATAHHADDNLETILMSLLNGDAHHVCRAIPPKRMRYIRPLLSITKQEILAFCEENGLVFRQDKSNFSTYYQRNYLRNVVIPTLHNGNGLSPYSLIEKEQHYFLAQQFLAQQFNLILQEVAPQNELLFERFLQKYEAKYLPICVQYWAENQGVKHSNQLSHILSLITAHVGSHYEIDENNWVVRTRAGLLKTSPLIRQNTETPVFIEKTQLNQAKNEIFACNHQLIMEFVSKENVVFGVENQFFVDYDKLVFPLIVRPWEYGDKMKPFGMKGSKKLSDIWVDNKYSPTQLYNSIVVADLEKIILFKHFRISDKVKIDNQTQQILKITLLVVD